MMMPDALPFVGFRVIARSLALMIAMSGCTTPAGPLAVSPPVAPAPVAIGSPPEWRTGDRWVYGWTSGSEAGTKTVEVIELREVNQVTYYLVRINDLIHFYTRELQWAGTMRDQRVESRMAPPLPWFAWPLDRDKRWTYQGTYADASGKRFVTDRFSVTDSEPVQVPAGRFRVLRIIRETDRGDLDEYWYAPDVGFYVRWIGRRGDSRFEEQLREYHRAPRVDTTPPATAPPSTIR
jgi:hypothetical protein